ncbi:MULTISPECIES: filamentous hemagglutinin N-terminal domain-containing protein [unclassified Nodularia (in: cyanobacteria)]|uniref:two-partner secretion domain-containing protein n=1 Tax=unclassified Nodularia (in: cyanobacteria) TaxID=2656917 RepID=UPI001880596A|nr:MULTISPECIES: filamentous hemagglutinin N-terminal domain-containing protein [unclassified Nodularia (in: cyanobacteria)]MBE9200507.1 filamentous hemagglutinin N-terminal domain-containing protein [Nodularia sp. LEGE 06071]MCC2691215.1 filamentous hemagglutinin N-terminal domain-containing protein [Nodularia sp. LEGE 04288]
MKVTSVCWGVACGILVGGNLLPAMAQVTSDATTNTIVNSNGNNFDILNGINQGNNLFHSFSNFSIPTGGSVTFDLTNTPNTTTIFSRVTGGNVSHIDGLIHTLNSNNPVSLFLMNPNGIVFGQNASLNIGGSFVATTANSIKFADGTEFSAVNPANTPLLTMSVLVGLQMGSNPGAITINNTGHRLISGSPTRLGTTTTGLSVSSSKILALVGGNITLDGGILQASSGQIELGSASAGMINLDPSIWKFDYGNIHQFGNIQLSKQALVNVSGNPAGSIHFQGQNISLTGGSGVLSINQDNENSGDIVINASKLLETQGIGNISLTQSFIRTENTGLGTGGSLIVSAPQVQVLQGGLFSLRNFGAGTGGSISIIADNSLEMGGFSPLSPISLSLLNANTFGSGKAGDIQISTGTLRIREGGGIITFSRGIGAGGNSTINASQSIEVSGENPFNLSGSNVVTSAWKEGNAGRLTINTPRLSVYDGGILGSSTAGSGNSGNVVLNVSELIAVRGVGAASGLPSKIVAIADILSPAIQQQFGVQSFPTGSSGKLVVNTRRLEITDGGVVGVEHKGVGNAGNLEIKADTIFLAHGGSIAATTKSGEGGSINLQANTLVMRHGSNVTATAGNTGNGGNITINSPIILGLENSDIIANAFQGKGGNIDITTQGVLGLKFRPQTTPENDITASSQFGVSGTVQVNNIGVDPNLGLVELPTNVIDPSQQIATSCTGSEGSSFVAIGRGGIPQNPNQQIWSDRTWSDIRDLSTFQQTPALKAQIPKSPESLVQATSWRRNTQGQVELITDQSSAEVQQPLTCATVTHN